MSDKNDITKTVIKAGGSSLAGSLLPALAIGVGAGYLLYKKADDLSKGLSGIGGSGSSFYESIKETVKETVSENVTAPAESFFITHPAESTEDTVFSGEKRDTTGDGTAQTYSEWLKDQGVVTSLVVNAGNEITGQRAAMAGKNLANDLAISVSNEGRESFTDVQKRFSDLSPSSKILVGLGQIITKSSPMGLLFDTSAAELGAKTTTLLTGGDHIIDYNSGQAIGEVSADMLNNDTGVKESTAKIQTDEVAVSNKPTNKALTEKKLKALGMPASNLKNATSVSTVTDATGKERIKIKYKNGVTLRY